jgi:hypothetical protein
MRSTTGQAVEGKSRVWSGYLCHRHETLAAAHFRGELMKGFDMTTTLNFIAELRPKSEKQDSAPIFGAALSCGLS